MSSKDLGTQACTSKYLAQQAYLWGIPDLQNRVTVEFSTRMTRSLGRCYPERGIIRIATSLLKEPTLLEEALCHELAHIAVYELNGKKAKSHGPEWKALMRKAGFEPRTKLHWDGAPPPAPKKKQKRYLHIHRCPVCHAERTARGHGRLCSRWGSSGYGSRVVPRYSQ